MRKLILLMCMLSTQGCFYCDDVLPKAMSYTGNLLKINGYYYQIAYDNVIYNSHVMYANGVLLNMYGTENTVEEMDEYVRNQSKDSWAAKSKYNWGVFFIYDNTIRIHQLSGSYPHQEFIQEGIILNDTTFKIMKFTFNGKAKKKDEIYHFRTFALKPDSMNVFIKY